MFREEVLLGRVVDREATPADWAELDARSASDAGVWGRLADQLRACAQLEADVADATAVAELVEAPGGHGASRGRGGGRAAVGWVGGAAGWAAAACLGLIVLWGQSSGTGVTPTGGRPVTGGPGGAEEGPTVQTAGYTPIEEATPDQALARYLDAGRRSGRVVSELPAVFLGTETDGSGRQRAVYLRQIMETVPARGVFRPEVHEDELGRPTVVPVRVEPRGGGGGAL